MSSEFSQIIRSFEAKRTKRIEKLRRGVRNIEQAKRLEYAMAKDYVELVKHHNNDLLAYIQTHADYAHSKKPFDQFIEDCFAGADLMRVDPHELIAAVAKGMTLRDYLAKPAALYLASKRNGARVPSAVAAAPIPPAPTEEMTIEQQLERWRLRAIAAEQRAVALAQAFRAARQRIALLEKNQREMNALIRKARR